MICQSSLKTAANFLSRALHHKEQPFTLRLRRIKAERIVHAEAGKPLLFNTFLNLVHGIDPLLLIFILARIPAVRIGKKEVQIKITKILILIVFTAPGAVGVLTVINKGSPV